MSYQMKIDEMLDCLADIPGIDTAPLIREVEALADKLADAICAATGTTHGTASFQGVAFAGTCVPFFPAYRGQPLPEPFQYDNAEEWEESMRDPDLPPRLPVAL
jgi:hypothetical protein